MSEHRRADRERSRLPGCLAALMAAAVVLALGYVALGAGIKKLKDGLSGSPDYSAGTTTGKVTFEVRSGDTVAAMGRQLKSQGVIASVDAFIAAATADPASSKIQVGFYDMSEHMSAAAALAVLVDPANVVTTSVTIPEGLRAADVVSTLVKRTGLARTDFEAALQDPAIGLPEEAHGAPEGFLFPATYAFPPGATAVDMIKAMVDRWRQAAETDGLEAGAQALGYTPEQLMTIASLVQAEGRGDDMPKIARVIYNRLEGPGSKQGTNGLLQIDATVNYALGRTGVAAVTTDDTRTDSPYNTYVHPGLPPGPISNPGDEAIKAALHPAEGDWYYYVTVNLKTGETEFARTYDDFLRYRQQLKDYCEHESAGAC